MARVVLDKCITREEVDDNGTPYTTQIVYNYEFIDDFDEPQLGRLGRFLLKTILRYKSTSEKRDISLELIGHQSENSCQSSPLSNSSVTKQTSVIPSVKNWGPNVYDKDNHTMTLMVRVIFVIPNHHVCKNKIITKLFVSVCTKQFVKLSI